MLFKFFCAVVLALSAVLAFANGTLPTCRGTPTAADLVNRCAPEVTFYVGGASAQAASLTKALLTPGLFFDASKPFAKVRDIALSVSGSGSPSAALPPGKDGNTIAFVGMGASGTGLAAGKRLAVIYNQANGSFAAVKQMLDPKASLKLDADPDENTTLVLTSLAEQKAGTGKGVNACNVSPVAADKVPAQPGVQLGYWTFECTTEAPFATAWGMDKVNTMALALSDLRPSEAVPGVITRWKPAAFPTVTTGMQGFGVIVSPNLYTALIAKEVAAGNLSRTCLTSEVVGNGNADTVSAACQPNLPNGDYTALVTGAVTTADSWLGTTGDNHRIVVARRTNASGTQAVSNIFFANQAGIAPRAVDQATDAAPTVLPGNPANPGQARVYGSVHVFEKSSTSEVITAVASATADSYAIGVVSLGSLYNTTVATSALQGAQYVKLGGISPNLIGVDDVTTVDATARAAIQLGYPMVYAMQAVTSAKLGEPYATLASKLIVALQDPEIDLPGIAYIASSQKNKNTPYLRAKSNYAPLSR
jgi:hypothetical protein